MNEFLERLRKVNQTGKDRWIACCPSHEDKKPSLAIRDVDGKILLKCFAGCSAFDVVSAIGLTLSDLFPENTGDYSKPIKNAFPAADVLRCIQHEAIYVAVTAANLAKGVELTESDRNRLMIAAGRIGGAYE